MFESLGCLSYVHQCYPKHFFSASRQQSVEDLNDKRAKILCCDLSGEISSLLVLV